MQNPKSEKQIDQKAKFIAVNIAILTISDSRTMADDSSGDLLEKKCKEDGHCVIDRRVEKDNITDIQKAVKAWCKNPKIDAVITTGGTGLTGRDVTPEALIGIFDKTIDGFGEMFRAISFAKIGTSALQSRAVAGVLDATYVFALPGSPSACRDGWDEILKWQLDNRHRPCNFVEIMPRLSEK